MGRFANRIANGQFELEGKRYQLAQNDGPNHLHGGNKGFDKVVWQAKQAENGIQLSYESEDGDENYPGNLLVKVIYRLEDNALRIDYEAKTDAATIINLTNHSYFNLSGADTILEHELKLNADRFTPIDKTFIPTGDLANVAKTPFDFREFHPIGERIFDQNEQLQFADGYDHNWVLNSDDNLTLAATLREHTTGRQLEVFTTQPGIQFYSGNMLPELKGKGGKLYEKHAGQCLETQHFPDSPNKPLFPSVVLNPDEIYKQSTVFKFSVFS